MRTGHLILALSGAFAAGGAAGIFGYRWYEKRNQPTEYEERMEAVKEEQATKVEPIIDIELPPLKDLELDNEEEDEDEEDEEDDSPPAESTQPNNSPTKYWHETKIGVEAAQLNRDKEALNNIMKRMKYYDRDEGPEDDAPDAEEPFVITQNEYFNCSDQYMQETYEYYPVDQVFVDSMNDDVIEDYLPIFGEVIIEKIDAAAEAGEDAVYIKNESLGKVYEVVINNGMSYSEDVLGENEE